MKVFGEILSMCFALLTLFFMVQGIIDYATFCAVSTLTSKYITDQIKTKEAN